MSSEQLEKDVKVCYLFFETHVFTKKDQGKEESRSLFVVEKKEDADVSKDRIDHIWKLSRDSDQVIRLK